MEETYGGFLNDQGYDMKEELSHFYKMLEEENKKEEENTQKILSEIKDIVSSDYLESIKDFLKDEDNGIWGGLKLVDKPIGEWQDEYQDEEDDTNYWNNLKGMYVNQSCGYSGDDYNGTLEIKITDKLFLRCSFSL